MKQIRLSLYLGIVQMTLGAQKNTFPKHFPLPLNPISLMSPNQQLPSITLLLLTVKVVSYNVYKILLLFFFKKRLKLHAKLNMHEIKLSITFKILEMITYKTFKGIYYVFWAESYQLPFITCFNYIFYVMMYKEIFLKLGGIWLYRILS